MDVKDRKKPNIEGIQADFHVCLYALLFSVIFIICLPY